ncbi:hypothetical protein L195_g052257 [Trifolium pratense]|uniref:Uncharacterized protein n=1 Tax=Trifolium pratense TaxID=57577 RepID=A0A2K3K441_TRIPR|nr:hypothetical protein L195_g052257 [Trifolium pratense]
MMKRLLRIFLVNEAGQRRLLRLLGIGGSLKHCLWFYVLVVVVKAILWSCPIVDNGRTYRCSILAPPNRGMFVRYIGDGWYSYLEDLKPRIGDKLNFIVSSSKTRLMVKLIRREDRR